MINKLSSFFSIPEEQIETEIEAILKKIPSIERLVRFAIEHFKESFYMTTSKGFQHANQINLTSCLHTTMAINQIFLEKKEFKLLKNLILTTWQGQRTTNSQKLSFENIFFNDAFIEEFDQKDEKSTYEGLALKIYAKVEQSLNPILNNLHQDLFRTLDINRQSLTRLKAKIDFHHRPGSLNSQLYNIFILHNFDQEMNVYDQSEYLHTFSIEQSNNSIGSYRIYQSFIQRYTLLDHLEETGEYSHSMMEAFLSSLENILTCSDQTTYFQSYLAAFKTCFNVETIPRYPLFKIELLPGEMRLGGTVLFFTQHALSYQNCVTHLKHRILSSARLKKIFLEKLDHREF